MFSQFGLNYLTTTKIPIFKPMLAARRWNCQKKEKEDAQEKFHEHVERSYEWTSTESGRCEELKELEETIRYEYTGREKAEGRKWRILRLHAYIRLSACIPPNTSGYQSTNHYCVYEIICQLFYMSLVPLAIFNHNKHRTRQMCWVNIGAFGFDGCLLLVVS